MSFTDHDTDTICPHCDAEMDGAMAVNGDRGPAEGDVSICVYCAQITVFTADLELRKPTEDEAVRLGLDPYLATVQSVVEDLLNRSPDLDRRGELMR